MRPTVCWTWVLSRKFALYVCVRRANRLLRYGCVAQIVDQSGMPSRSDRITAIFSATFPKEIQLLAQDFLQNDYVFLAVGRVGSTSKNIVQKVIWVEENEKRAVLTDLLDASDRDALRRFVDSDDEDAISTLPPTSATHGRPVIESDSDDGDDEPPPLQIVRSSEMLRPNPERLHFSLIRWSSPNITTALRASTSPSTARASRARRRGPASDGKRCE